MRIKDTLVLLSFATLAVDASAAVSTTVVDVPVEGATQRFLYLRPDAPRANIVHIPGSDGIFGIQDDGSMTGPNAPCSPINRNRDAFAGHGFSLALVDGTSNGRIYNFADIQEVVRYMQARDNLPTWVIGGSHSTAAISSLAINLPAASSIGAVFYSPFLLQASQAAQIRRPTLVVYHTGDTGQFGNQLFNALTAAPIKERAALSGGSNTGACGYGFHLFSGIDALFVSTVTSFIDRHNDSFTPTPPSLALAVEFYNAALDHYFLTHIAGEIALLDAGVTIKGWARTGQSFNVYANAAAGSSPVCRYYIPPDKGDSHFYGRGTVECNATGTNNPTFINEDPQFFHIGLPNVGVCPAGTRSVYRTFSNRADANHRYMVDRSIRDQMEAQGWLPEGDGPDLVVMCSPL